MNEHGHNSSTTNLIAYGISVFTISLAVFFFSLLLFAAGRGLDYSDESYSYLWARYPYEYRFALRLSGFFLHPLELLVQHTVAGLRLAGMLLTAASGILIGVIAANAAGRAPTRWERAELIATCGIAMFLSNIYWFNTPSYQHMTVWGLALLLAGFAMLVRKAPISIAQRLGTAALIAGGGLILAFAKIPSAMAAAALTLGLVLFAYEASGAARWRMLGLIALVEGLLLAGTAALVSPSLLLELLREGISLRTGYGSLHDVLAKHLVDIRNMPTRFIGIFAIAVASILMMLAATSRRRMFGIALLTAALALGAVATCAALVFVNPVGPILDRYNVGHHGLGMSALAFSVLVLASAAFRYRKPKIGRERFVLAVLLILAPWIASLGTGNAFLNETAFFSGFSGLAIILVGLEMPQAIAQATRLFVVLMSGATLYFAALHPYRLNRPIMEQNVPVVLDGLNGGSLLVDAPTASFFSNLHDRARAAGLLAGTPLFDLAGYGPGFNLALGTKPPVYPWIAAGYPNSPAILDKIWSLTPVADRGRAWIVGPIHNSFQGAAALSELMPLDSNYELVLKIAEPQSGMNVELWRPRNAAAAGRL
jgi:hypothetical protein